VRALSRVARPTFTVTVTEPRQPTCARETIGPISVSQPRIADPQPLYNNLIDGLKRLDRAVPSWVGAVELPNRRKRSP
jgi:hypothetical protein